MVFFKALVFSTLLGERERKRERERDKSEVRIG